MIVLDSSAALEALVGRPVDPGLSERLRSTREIHAPHLIDVEVTNGLRKLVMRKELDPNRAADALQDFEDLAIVRYPHLPLVSRMWSLRENLTAHDAVFVALAESLSFPLITCDARMSRAPGLEATVELFAGARGREVGKPAKRKR